MPPPTTTIPSSSSYIKQRVQPLIQSQAFTRSHTPPFPHSLLCYPACLHTPLTADMQQARTGREATGAAVPRDRPLPRPPGSYLPQPAASPQSPLPRPPPPGPNRPEPRPPATTSPDDTERPLRRPPGQDLPAPRRPEILVPSPQGPPYFYGPPPRRRASSAFASCLAATAFLLLAAGGAGAALFLLFRPRPPDIAVEAVRLPSFAAGNGTVAFTFQQTAVVRNPNRSPLAHFDSSLRVAYAGVGELGYVYIPAGLIDGGRAKDMSASFDVPAFPAAATQQLMQMPSDQMAAAAAVAPPVIEVDSLLVIKGRVTMLRVLTHRVQAAKVCRVGVSPIDGRVLGFRC